MQSYFGLMIFLTTHELVQCSIVKFGVECLGVAESAAKGIERDDMDRDTKIVELTVL